MRDIEDGFPSNGRKRHKPNHKYHRLINEDAEEDLYYDGVISFRFDPYEIQKKYMAHIYLCLQVGVDCIAEAPTGSGKTLCLLNSIFAWIVNREDQKKNIKVIYTSRAHNQLEQLEKQLQKTRYRPNLVVFGGRSKLCINDKIKKLSSDGKKRQQCDKAVRYQKIYRKLKGNQLQGKDLRLLQQCRVAIVKLLESTQKKSVQFNLKILLKGLNSLEASLPEPKFGKSIQLLSKILRKQMQLQESDTILLKQIAQTIQNFINPNGKIIQQMIERGQLTQEDYKDVMEKRCPFYETEFQQRKETYMKIYQQLQYEQPITIKDEQTQCSTHGICPYFYPQTAKFPGDLIVMPYNYLLNPWILKLNQKILENSIIIFDEGHNVIENARQSMNIKFSISEFENGISYLKGLKNEKKKKKKRISLRIDQEVGGSEEEQYLQNQQVERENSREGRNKNQSTNSKEMLQKLVQKCIQELTKIKKNYQRYQFEQTLFKYQDATDKKGTILKFKGEDGKEIIFNLLDIFFGLKFSPEEVQAINQNQQDLSINFLELKNMITKIGDLLEQFKDQDDKVFFKLKNLAQKLDLLCTTIIQKNLIYYDLYFLVKKIDNNDELQILLYCYNPKFVFNQIKDKKPRSIILTSGTLQPLNSWNIQTGLDFKIMQSTSSHVVDKEQCLTVFLPNSIEGDPKSYTSGLNKANIPVNLESAYEILLKICRKVKNGVLVFFANSSWVSLMKKLIQDKGQKNFPKHPFYQDQIQNLKQFQKQYKTKCMEASGAILFGYCRGRVSQGIDFAQQLCRAVVIFGYPQPNNSDPFQVGKTRYFNSLYRKKLSPINAEQWKRIQIMRSVNQAIGRVIRSRDDYGLIFLIDKRYLQEKNKNNLSKWTTRNQITIDISNIEQTCDTFFKIQEDRSRRRNF